MSPKAALISAALLAALSLPTFAQTFSINGIEVPSDQVKRLQAHCGALAAAEAGSASDSSSATEATTGTEAIGTDPAEAAFSPEGSEMDTVTVQAGGTSADATASGEPVDTETLDLTTIDLEACLADGIVAADGTVNDSPA